MCTTDFPCLIRFNSSLGIEWSYLKNLLITGNPQLFFNLHWNWLNFSVTRVCGNSRDEEQLHIKPSSVFYRYFVSSLEWFSSSTLDGFSINRSSSTRTCCHNLLEVRAVYHCKSRLWLISDQRKKKRKEKKEHCQNMTVKNPETKISLHHFKRKRFSCARLSLLNWVDITDALAHTRIKT